MNVNRISREQGSIAQETNDELSLRQPKSDNTSLKMDKTAEGNQNLFPGVVGKLEEEAAVGCKGGKKKANLETGPITFASSHKRLIGEKVRASARMATGPLERVGTLKDGSKVTFRPAAIADIPAIVRNYNANALGKDNVDNTTGFLSQETTFEERLKAFIQKDIYVACDAEGDVIASLALSPNIARDRIDRLAQENPGLQGVVTGARHLNITDLVVAKGKSGRGIGKFFYDTLFAIWPDITFTAFIVVGGYRPKDSSGGREPVKNIRSKKFHERNGFEAEHSFRYDFFAGLKDYEAMLMVRSPQ